MFEKKKCSIIIFLFSEGNPVGELYVECSAAQMITRRFYDSIVEGAHHTGACVRVRVCVSAYMRLRGRLHAFNVNSLMEGLSSEWAVCA